MCFRMCSKLYVLLSSFSITTAEDTQIYNICIKIVTIFTTYSYDCLHYCTLPVS